MNEIAVILSRSEDSDPCLSAPATPYAPRVCDMERRFALKSASALLMGLTAGCSGCGGSSSAAEQGSSALSGDPTQMPTSGEPAASPSGRPVGSVPTAPSGAYRNAQPYLFDSIVRPVEPARIPGAPDLDLDIVGPHRDYVDFSSGWKWRNAGGDWIDANASAMGSAAWASVQANAARGADASADYATDVSAALQFVQTQRRWNAWIVNMAPGSTAPRTLAARFHPDGAARPVVDVTYLDGSQATLACRVSAVMSPGMNAPRCGSPEMALPVALEFDLPTKEVKRATLRFRVTKHWDGANPTVQFFLADPPLNRDATSKGVADGYPLDSGLANHPSIIGQQRCQDGARYEDYFSGASVDVELASSYSPELTGGAKDTSKLPYLDRGKWVGGGFRAGGASVVASTYVGEGFQPLATGIGAIRVRMDKAGGIGNSVEGGQNGTAAAHSFIMMPAERFGLQRRLFVRYYMRIGLTADTGNPYRPTLAQKYQVLKLGVPTWTDMAGKCSIGAAHKTKRGGNSGTAGGGYGWTLRRTFDDYVSEPDAPAAGGWGNGWSFYDFQNNPPGHNYASDGDQSLNEMGQRGGLGGVLYANRWYCIEEEVYLNSVDRPASINGAPHLINGVQQFWTPDGAVRFWIDGRLAYERTGMVLRSLPVVEPPTGYLPGIRELGVAHLWFNWFHGGLTRNSIDRVLFVTGLAYGDQYIGPMKI